MVLAHNGSGPNGLRIAYIVNLHGNKNRSQPKQPHGTGSLQKMEICAFLPVPSTWEKRATLSCWDWVPFSPHWCFPWGLTGDRSPCSGADRTGVVWLPGWIWTALSLTPCCLLINALMNCLLIPIIILIFGGERDFKVAELAQGHATS